MCVTYTLQQLFKKEMERLQEHNESDKRAKWFNCFDIVPKTCGITHLCLDPVNSTKHSWDQYIEGKQLMIYAPNYQWYMP